MNFELDGVNLPLLIRTAKYYFSLKRIQNNRMKCLAALDQDFLVHNPRKAESTERKYG